MTARLQAATTSGKPILLRVDYMPVTGRLHENASRAGVGGRMEFSVLAVWDHSISGIGRDFARQCALNM